MKNKNNLNYSKTDVSASLGHYRYELNVPCKLVRNKQIERKNSPLVFPLTKRQEEEIQAKNTSLKPSLVCPFFRFRKNGERVIALKRSIFSSIYFFYFLNITS
jgi:hypothetical protein